MKKELSIDYYNLVGCPVFDISFIEPDGSINMWLRGFMSMYLKKFTWTLYDIRTEAQNNNQETLPDFTDLFTNPNQEEIIFQKSTVWEHEVDMFLIIATQKYVHFKYETFRTPEKRKVLLEY